MAWKLAESQQKLKLEKKKKKKKKKFLEKMVVVWE
jgi:hypothetical protein